MIKVGFIGGYDKTDFLMSLAKVLTAMNTRVLVVDSTLMQKAKYVVPTIDSNQTYITTFERIDVAVGFTSEEMLASYIGASLKDSTDYDMALLDIDTSDAFVAYDMENADLNFFTTAFDMYSLKKGLEILTAVQNPIPLTKILFSKALNKKDEQYLNYLTQNCPVAWNENTIYFMCAESDNDAFKENYRAERIKFKKLSSGYKLALATVLVHMFSNYKTNDFLKLMKNIDKG